MKNVITALANPELNEILKKEKEINIEYNDIQYQDGVLEILKENNKIDILILSEILPGKQNIKEFILEIKKQNNNLEIIIFLENKKEDLEMFLKMQGIFNIYYNNEINSNTLIKKIKNKKDNKEIKLIKKIIENNKDIKEIKKEKKIKNKIINKIIKKFKKEKIKIYIKIDNAKTIKFNLFFSNKEEE